MSNPFDSIPDDEGVPARPAGGIAARAMAASRSAAADYFDGLNPEQMDAVQSLDGPLLVLAGAGTGKTRVLTTRIAHILATGRAYPSQILAVTFTNKAAREMKERIGRMVGEAVEGMPWLGTFHSIGVKILRRNAELVGLKSDFTILDTDDQIRLLKQLIRAEGIDDKRWPARVLAGHIDSWKNKGLSPDQVSEGDARSFGDGRGRELYQQYQERLKILNACDFGDLLTETIRLFKENPDVLREYNAKFKYILVDEYQDTNVAQYMWLRLLAQRPSTLSEGVPAPPPVHARAHLNEPNAGAAAEGGQNSALTRAASQPLRESAPSGAVDISSPQTPLGDEENAHLGTSPSVAGQAGEASASQRTDDGPDGSAGSNKESKSLAAPNICCVGDDDQSIYGWRGAEVDNILRFEKDFPGAKVVRLERNYRSTAHILGAAGHLIANNEGRLGKTLFTEHADPDDPKVIVSAGWDSEEEARTIGDEIEALQNKGYKLNEIAILVRASFQMREFEDRFVTMGLNYRVIGGPRFYERMEIRDAMAYFRVVCQPADDLAFERIVNTPKRGIGDATLRIIHDNARARAIPLTMAARELTETEELKPKVRATIKSVLDNFDRWRSELDSTSHTELAEIILEESGYTEMWQNDRSADAPGRLENLKELIRSMEEFENLPGFLEHVSLVMDTDNNADMDAVSLMTLHSAKGLEFDSVFLPGWEEGLFPHQRSLDEGGRSGLEEERRLAYVGITRARQRCYISFVSNRRIHGLWQASIPSRFVDELPEVHVEVNEGSTSYGGYGSAGVGGRYGASRFDNVDTFDSGYSSPGWQRAKGRSGTNDSNWGNRSGPKTSGSMGRVIEGQLVASSINETSKFSVGDRVFHLKFGNGNIASIDGNKLTIDFDKAGQKRVLDSFVEAV
ncbi:MAG: UvrD-helicase domain-containing protein [Pseudomonadota bacterium]